MVEYYNLSNLSSGNDIAGFTASLSTNVLGGDFIGLILLMVTFSVFFLATKRKGYFTSACFAVSCWMTSLAAMLLRPIGLINDYMWWVALALTPIAIFVLFIAGSD
jgi:signal transduction histidine kinase